MDLDKLFGSKTKVDILKYLTFKREGISMRALESEVTRTFPAIKKQIDALALSKAVYVDKNSSKRSIYIEEDFKELIRDILLYALEKDITTLLKTYEMMIDRHYLGKTFGFNIEADIILIYKNCENQQLERIKEEVGHMFKNYFIDIMYITCMSQKERDQRYRLADRFVLSIMREVKR